jgi:hypothetical protein
MTALDDNDDSYVLPQVPSNDDCEDSEDERFKSITRPVHDTGHEVARNPAHKPETEAEVPPVAAAATAANPLPAAVCHLLPVDAGTAVQKSPR